MNKKQWLFIVFALVLVVLLSQFNTAVQLHFSGAKEARATAEALKQQLNQEKLKNQVLAYQLQDFKQSVSGMVAGLKPKNPKEEYNLRTLASISDSQPEGIKIDYSQSMLNQAKEEFKQKYFQRAISKLEELIETYPLSPHVIEAYFLIAESSFLDNDYQKCLEVIDFMMTQYPQHDLTGFLLLRMAEIFNMRRETDNAIEVYRTVVRQFGQNKQLVKIASTQLDKIENE